jgi:Bacterial Ig-like domain
MGKEQNTILFLTLVLMLAMSLQNFFSYGQDSSVTGSQQTAVESGLAPTINYNVNPPPNPVIQQSPPPLLSGASNSTDQQSGATITDPIVLAIAFVGAAAGVIYRTIYPYFERLHEMEVQGQQPVKFLTKYKFTFGISLLISLVTTMGLFSGLLPQLDINAGLGMVFISSFVQGIGWNELTNRVSYKITDRKVEQEAAKKEQPSIIKMAKGAIPGKAEESEAPKIVGRYPVQGQGNIRINSPIAVFFGQPMDSSTITKDTFTLKKDGSDVNIDGEINLEENGKTVIFNPKEDLQKDTKYAVTLTKEVKNQAGNKMDSDETWSFTTTIT